MPKIEGELLARIVFVIGIAVLSFFVGVALAYKYREDLVSFRIDMRRVIDGDIGDPRIINAKKNTPEGFVRYRDGAQDDYLLVTGYLLDTGDAGAILLSTADGRILRRWYVPYEELATRAEAAADVFQENHEKRHALLLSDGGLVFHMGTGPLVRIDACSDIRWVYDDRLHHAIIEDLDGNFLVPGYNEGGPFGDDYIDDTLAVISPEGSLVSEISIGEIMIENGYEADLRHLDRDSSDWTHLNEVDIARASVGAWQAGDLAFSLRSTSTVFVWRPSTGKIVWFKTGPWLKQHDPSFLPDGRLSVFDNNNVFRGSASVHSATMAGRHSDVVLIDPTDNSVERPWREVLVELDFGTPTQGRSRVLETGELFVEETDHGRIFLVDQEGPIWSYYNAADGKAGKLSWSRYYTAEEIAALDLPPPCAG